MRWERVEIKTHSQTKMQILYIYGHRLLSRGKFATEEIIEHFQENFFQNRKVASICDNAD